MWNLRAAMYDWHRRDIVGGDDVEGWGGRVVRLREVPGVRTSLLLARAKRGARTKRPSSRKTRGR